MKKNNVLWDFFASVKLALFTLIALATTSIIGTIIPQGEPMSFYVENFGPAVATVFKYLRVPDMYNAWWFLSLLVLFALNLTVCSLERIPNVIRILKSDNLDTDVSLFAKLRDSIILSSNLGVGEAASRVPEIMSGTGWKTTAADKEGGKLFFSQKGGWTRFGVYSVHTSILIIFIGAIIGSLFGYKASIMLPEGDSTTEVYLRGGSHAAKPLGFTLSCDRFDLTYYGNGMPKDYISLLKVKKDGQTVLTKQIEVNDPLQYAGLTFYQSSYRAIDGQYTVYLSNEKTGAEKNFITVPMQETKWDSEKLSFGIVERRGPDFMGKYRLKIWFNDHDGKPVEFWADESKPVTVNRKVANYRFEIKGRFATGLQVAKDPGVWWVYVGCSIMILGLIVVFFLSHRRVWIWVSGEGKKTSIVISGNANKNKPSFEKDLERIAAAFRKDEKLGIKAA